MYDYERVQKQNRERRKKVIWQTVLIALFTLILGAGFIIGCFFMSARPDVSNFESRKLTEFPEFTWESFWDGSYTSQISTWFADTYPMREEMLKKEQEIKTYYGFQEDAVAYIASGDEIPDLEDPDLETEPEETESQETKPSEIETETSSEEPESTEEETKETYANVDGQELANMNPQEAGKVNILGNTGYCVYGFNRKAADKYAEYVSMAAEALKGTTKVYDILIPDNSAIMLDDATKTEWNLQDEKKVIRYYHQKIDSLTDLLTHVEIYDTLAAHSNEYLYYYTDHHWTQLAAYYAYVEFCEAKGIEAFSIDEYEVINSGSFLGSYYKSNGYGQLADHPDTVISYLPVTINQFSFMDDSIHEMRSGKLIRNMSEFEETLKYYGYIYGDNSYSVIENPNVTNGESCIVIKESFGNPFVPFLADHYSKVYILDYRAYKESAVELAKKEKVTDLIFINNLEAISDAPTMDVMGNLCK